MGRYVRGILRAWTADAKGHEITLIARDAAQIADIAAETTLPVLSFADARRKKKNERFAVVWYPWNGIRFRLPRAACVTTIYDMFAFTQAHPEFVARYREQAPIRRALKHSQRICTISEWSASEIRRVRPRLTAPISIAPPVPNIFWQPGGISPAGDIPYMLLLAGPEPRKNVPFAVKAMEQAFPRGEVEFIVAGNLAEDDERRLRASHCHYRRVQPDDEELRALYTHACAVLVPSRAEGYGLMVVEAMSCGAPVIAAKASGVREAADGAALLVDPDHLQVWVEAVRTMYEDTRLREQYIESARARVARIDHAAPARITLDALTGAVAELTAKT